MRSQATSFNLLKITTMKDDILKYVRGCSHKATLLELQEAVQSALDRLPRVTPNLMRSFEEYLDARNEDYGDEITPESLPLLRESLIAPGRQFKLTNAQLQLAESMAGKLAFNEVSIYNVTLDAKEERVLSFSFQCNVPRESRRKGGLVTALHIDNAQKFFSDAKRLEEIPESASSLKPSVKKESKINTQAKEEARKLLHDLLGQVKTK